MQTDSPFRSSSGIPWPPLSWMVEFKLQAENSEEPSREFRRILTQLNSESYAIKKTAIRQSSAVIHP
jgi:hypothetical protein